MLVLVGCRLAVEGCLGRCVLVESRDRVADECFDREVTVTVCTGTRVVVRRENTVTVDGTMPSTEEAASAPDGGEKAAVTSVMLTSDMMRDEKNKFPNGPACREGYERHLESDGGTGGRGLGWIQDVIAELEQGVR